MYCKSYTYQKKRIDAGLCRTCGGPAGGMAKGFCDSHYKKHKKAVAEYSERKKNAESEEG